MSYEQLLHEAYQLELRIKQLYYLMTDDQIEMFDWEVYDIINNNNRSIESRMKDIEYYHMLLDELLEGPLEYEEEEQSEAYDSTSDEDNREY